MVNTKVEVSGRNSNLDDIIAQRWIETFGNLIRRAHLLTDSKGGAVSNPFDICIGSHAQP